MKTKATLWHIEFNSIKLAPTTYIKGGALVLLDTHSMAICNDANECVCMM